MASASQALKKRPSSRGGALGASGSVVSGSLGVTNAASLPALSRRPSNPTSAPAPAASRKDSGRALGATTSHTMSKEEVTVLGRNELEAIFLTQQQDHARRKEAFDTINQKFNQSEQCLEKERTRAQSVEKDNKVCERFDLSAQIV